MLVRTSSGGGAERVALRLADYYVENGHSVSYIYYYDTGQYEKNTKIDTYCLCRRMRSIKLLRTIDEVLQTRRFFKLNKFKSLLIFGYSPAIEFAISTLGLKKTCMVIMSERNDPSRNTKKRYIDWLRSWAYSKSDKVVFQTEDAKNYFSDIIKQKGFVIPNPIENKFPDRFSGNRIKTIVTAGRLTAQKNLPLLINAFACLHHDFPDYHLIVYGDGELKEELLNQCRELGIINSVSFPGFDKDCMIKSRDVAMYVSSSDYEGISNSILEALCLGIPVVATDCPVGGNRLMIEEGNSGFLTPTGDEEKLYQKMKLIINSPVLSDKLSRNAIKNRDKFRVEKIASTWLKLMNE